MSEQRTPQVIGPYPEALPHTDEHLTINFSPGSAPRSNRWRNNGLSADFLGDYFATFFLGEDIPGSKIGKQETVKGAVSYIANELLENAMKYNEESAKLPVSISLYLFDEKLVFLVSNFIRRTDADSYRQYAEELVSSDVDELYTARLENAGMGGESRLGLLTILNDYEAQLGWKFEGQPDDENLCKVTTMVQFPV